MPERSGDGYPKFNPVGSLGKKLSDLVDAIRRDRLILSPGCGLTATPTPSGRVVAVGRASPTPCRYAKTDGSGISGRSGTTLGSGTVTFYSRAGDDLTLGTDTATCRNASTAAVAANTTIVVGLDDGGGYCVLVESCGA